jgi:tetratricopeptide (TPR) repeat protein
LTGKVSEAIPYLEDAVERMKDSFGPKHYGVGYVYNNLGAAYMEMDRPQSAAQMFALAKEVMDVSLGPHHSDTIEACQSLANSYNAMGRYYFTNALQYNFFRFSLKTIFSMILFVSYSNITRHKIRYSKIIHMPLCIFVFLR